MKQINYYYYYRRSKRRTMNITRRKSCQCLFVLSLWRMDLLMREMR